MVIFRSGTLYSLCSPGNQDENYSFLIFCFIKGRNVVFLLELVLIINESCYNQAYMFLIIELQSPISTFFDEKIKK